MRKIISIVVSAIAIFGLVINPANAAVSATLSKSTNLLIAGEIVTVTLSGIPAGQGVYVRLCKEPASGTRPASTDCYGGAMGGVWASLDVNQQALGAQNAANPLSLPVIGEFTNSGNTVNCNTSKCVVFIRRDHNGGGADFSLDTTIPVSFETSAQNVTSTVPAPTIDQTISPFWDPKKYNTKAKRNSIKTIARSAMLTTQGNSLTWSSSTPKTCSVMQVKKYVKVKFLAKGACEFTATASATETYKPTVFTWKYSVR